MRYTVRIGQTKSLFTMCVSYATHSPGGGQRTVNSQMSCPITAHSPTANICLQQLVPNQCHSSALPSQHFRPSSVLPTCPVDLMSALYSHIPSLSIGLSKNSQKSFPCTVPVKTLPLIHRHAKRPTKSRAFVLCCAVIQLSLPGSPGAFRPWGHEPSGCVRHRQRSCPC